MTTYKRERIKREVQARNEYICEHGESDYTDDWEMYIEHLIEQTEAEAATASVEDALIARSMGIYIDGPIHGEALLCHMREYMPDQLDYQARGCEEG